MPIPLQEVLSRLPIQGGTQVGGSSTYASYLPILNSNGVLDPSFFSSTILNAVNDVANQTARLALTAKIGDIAIQADNQTAYVLAALPASTNNNWRVIGASYANAAVGVTFDNTGTNLTSTTVQAALVELWTNSLIVNAPRTATSLITFNVSSSAPFAIGAGSTGQLVAGLNADQLDGQHGSYYTNASNISSGILPTGRLSGTYPISISGTAAISAVAVSAQNADHATTADSATNATHATTADSATTATTATNATQLNGQLDTFYTNAANLSSGILPGARFDDTSHGNRSGGTLHDIATISVAGFMSATDKTKLNSIEDGAEVNQNAFSTIAVGTDSIVALDQEDILTLASVSPEITVSADVPNKKVNIAFTIGAIQHSSLGGLTNDDHPQYVHTSIARTISATHTFNPTGIGPAFLLGSNATGQLIPGLNTDLLDGRDGSFYQNASNIITGTLAPSRLQSGGTYPINITGTASGSLPVTGGTISGSLSVDLLTVTSLAGTGDRLVLADPSGNLTIGATSDDLPEGSVNLYATDSRLFSAISSMIVDSSDITWSNTGNTRKATIIANSDRIVEGTTNKYVTWPNVQAVLNLGSALLINGSNQLVTDHTTAATANKLVMRDNAGGINAAAGNFTTVAASTMTVSTPLTGNDPSNRVVDKAYADSIATNHTHPNAIYDLPITVVNSQAARLALTSVDIGEIVQQGSSYYVLTRYPSTDDGNWQIIDLTPTSTIKPGFISGKEWGQLLKLATLVQSQAAGTVFCAPLRVCEPIQGPGANSYSNPNWKRYSRRTLQTRGRGGKNYFLLLSVKGWVKKQHKWQLTYSTYNTNTHVNDSYVITLNSFTTEQPDVNPYHLGNEYEYVDKIVPLIVSGGSAMILELYAFDGKFTQLQSGVIFPGIAPYSTSGTADPFNGGFIQIEGKGVWSTNPNEPYNPLSPDLLIIQSEGEAISGGLTNFPADPNTDNRVYDGETITDSQDVVNKFVLSGYADDENLIPTYSVNNSTSSPVAYEKSRQRCNYSVFNKLSGFSGFLRVNTSVTSGKGLTAPLSPDQGGLVNVPLTSNKLSQDIIGTSLVIGNGGGKTADLTGVTNLLGLVTAINATDNIRVTYDGTTDRFNFTDIEDQTGHPAVPPVYYDTTSYPSSEALKVLRVGWGAAGRTIGISLPCASGLRISDTISVANFTTPASLVNGNTGKFRVDDIEFTYNATTTIQSIINSLDSAGFTLTYDAEANEFILRKKTGAVTDLDSLTPPRAYDIIGNLMVSLGLDKESHGNADFPIEAVHRIVYQSDSILVGGSFRNYCGSTSAGIAKIGFDGKVDPHFNVGAGFDAPIYTIASGVAGDSSIYAAGIEPASFNGYNRQSITKLSQDGVDITPSTLKTIDITGDNQNRVLNIIPFVTGEFAVLTPRKLIIYNSDGSIANTYTGNRSFHGMCYYKEDNSPARSYFLLASTAYVGPTATQKFNGIGEPLGLRLLAYDHVSKTVSIDSVWAQLPSWIPDNPPVSAHFGPGAGTGAEASCAYPIVGGFDDSGLNTYVICGNRGVYWNSEQETDPGNTAWDERGSGNLLLESDSYLAQGDPTAWPWKVTGTGLQAIVQSIDGLGRQYSILTNDTTDSGEIGIVSQTFDATLYRAWADTAPISNPGSVGYKFSIDIKRESNTGTDALNNPTSVFPYIGVQFGNSGNANSFVVFCLFDTQTGAHYDGISASQGHVTVTPNDPNNPTVWTVTIQVTDSVIPNLTVTPIIYPAYTSIFNNGPKQAVNRSITVYGSSLRYAFWADDYVRTTTQQLYPSSGSTSIHFRGLYKIGLEGDLRGKAWPGFATHIEHSEPQSHPIPFGVDSQNRIYLGGPISAIGDTNDQLVDVTPWRLYRLTEDGKFDKEYLFNDVVTSCIVTPYDKLIVGGKFDCYNKRAVGKLAFLTLDGDVVDDINPPQDNVIVSDTAPDTTLFPDDKNKLWLDTSVDPPFIKVWDDIQHIWVGALTASMRLPDPVFVTTPTNTTIDVTRIDFEVPGGFTIKTSGWTDPKDVKITYRINDNSAPSQVYDPSPSTGGIFLPTEGTYTIYAEATAPGNNTWYGSRTVFQYFIVRAQTPTPTITTTPNGSYAFDVTVSTLAPGANVLYYRYNTVDGPPANPVFINGSNSTTFTVNNNQTIVAKAQAPNERESGLVTQAIVITLANSTIALTDTPINGSPFAINRGGGGTGILYSIGPGPSGGPDPTAAAYNAIPATPGVIYFDGTTYTDVAMDHQGFGSGTTMVIKSRSVIKDATSGRITVEQGTTTSLTLTRLGTLTFNPTGTLVKNGAGNYEIDFNDSPALTGGSDVVKYDFGTSLTGIPTTTATYTSGPDKWAATVTVPAGPVYNDFNLRARAIPGDTSVVASKITSVPFFWKRQAANVNFVTTAPYGITGFSITPQLSTDPTHHIKYSFIPGVTLTRTIGGTVYTVGSTVSLENVPDSLFNSDVLTITVLEWDDNDDPKYDTIGVATVTRYSVATNYAQLLSLADSNAVLTETATQNILTYNTTLANILEVHEASSGLVTFITYNNTGVIDHTITPDVSHTSSNGTDYTDFTPTAASVNSGTLTVRIKFFKSGFVPSRVISIPISMRLPLVNFSPAGGSVSGKETAITLTAGLSTATIYYTLNNTPASTGSSVYVDPLNLKTTTTVRAIAAKPGWLPAVEATAVYTFAAGADSGYGLVNLKCGTPINEVYTPPTLPTMVLLTDLGNGTVSQQGVENFGESDSQILNWQGKGLFGLTDTDFWNVIKPSQYEYWSEPRDSRGAGNINGTLQVRKYFNVNAAPNYFGPGKVNITDTGALRIDGLENTGLEADYGDGSIMLHVRGLNPGNYLLLAYGQKTQFDLDMYSGTCLSQAVTQTAKGKGFYDYGFPIFNALGANIIGQVATTANTYSTTVVPIRVFSVKALKKLATSNEFEWGVKLVSTNFVPFDWYKTLKTRTGNVLTNQKLFDVDSYNPSSYTYLSESGIVYLPTSANDGLDGFWNGDVANRTQGTTTATANNGNYPGNTNVLGTGSDFDIHNGFDFLIIAPAVYDTTYTVAPPNGSGVTYNEVPTDSPYFITNDLTAAKPLALTRILVDSTSFSAGSNLTNLMSYLYTSVSQSSLLGTTAWSAGETRWCFGAPSKIVPVLTGVGSGSNVVLSWTTVPDAISYNIYRATTHGGPYSLLTATSSLTYTDNTTSFGIKYFYVVTGVAFSGEGGQSNEVAVTPALLAPVLSLDRTSPTNLALSWTAVTGATSYNVKVTQSYPIYMVSGQILPAGSTAPYTVATVTAPTITLNELISSLPGSVITAGIYQTPIYTVVTSPPPPHQVLAGYTYTSYPTGSGSVYHPGPTYTPLNGGEGFYTLYVTAATAQTESPLSNAVRIPPAPVTGLTTSSTSPNTVTLNWVAPAGLPGADSYTIGRSTDNITYTTIGTTSSTTYTDINATGQSYYYRVAGVNNNGTGEYVTTPIVHPMPGAPTSLVATAGASSIALTWNAVSTATSYNIKRSTTNGGPYTTIGTA